ncbi:MAG TPA: hypothetical protein VEI50_01780 [Nitrospiraceae bacterium]|nr:hypothetical protein [Nitrospiraceae bacterium]
MSDDYTEGQRLASVGSSPDWNNQDQADGWRAQKLAEATRYVPPLESASPIEASSSWEAPPAWQPAQSWGTSSASWTSSSSVATVAQGVTKRLTRLLIGPVALAGGWMGYTYGQAQHWAGVQVAAAVGGAALVAAALLPVIIYLVMDLMYTLTRLAVGLLRISVRLLLLVVIIAGIGWVISLVAGW